MKSLFNNRSWGWWGGISGQACSQHDVLQLPLLSELSRRGSWNPHIRIRAAESRGQAEKENSVLPPRIIQELVPRKLVQKEYRSTRGNWRVRLNETYKRSLYLDGTTNNFDCCHISGLERERRAVYFMPPSLMNKMWKRGVHYYPVFPYNCKSDRHLNFYSNYKLPLVHENLNILQTERGSGRDLMVVLLVLKRAVS